MELATRLRLDLKVDCVKEHPILFTLLYSVFSLFLAIAWFVQVLERSAGQNSKVTYVWLFIISVIYIAFAILLIFQNKRSPEVVFLIIGIPALLAFGLLIIPDQVPDETTHIYRSMNFLGNWEMYIPPEIDKREEVIPRSYYALYQAILTPTDWNQKILYPLDLSSYLPHLYLFSGIMFRFCELLSLNAYVAIYLARLANVVVFLVFGYWAIKLIPLGKTVFTIYLLNPMLIQQEASCSADALVNIIVLSYVVLLIRCRFKPTISKKDLIILFVFAIAASLSKYAYAPLLLLLLILVPRVQNKRVRIGIYTTTIVVITLVLVFVLFFYSGESFSSSIELVRDPFKLLFVLKNTMFEMGPIFLLEFAGALLGPLNINIWMPCFWAYCLILFCALIFNLGEKFSFKGVEKVLLWAITIFLSIAIALLFRDWSLTVDKRDDVLMGVQGRYFIPFYILPLLTFIGPETTLTRKNCLIYYSITLFLIFSLDCIYILRKFS